MTNWSGRMPPSYTVTLYNEGTWDDNTPWSGIIVNNQVWTGRANTEVSNTMPVLITGIWNDTLLWDDLLYWNDNGNTAGTSWTGRTIPL